MISVVFIAPMLSENASRMIVAAAGLPGVRLGVISHDPLAAAPEWARASIAGHWQVANILDVAQLETGVRGIAGQWMGTMPRCVFGAYEQAQEPIAALRERLGLPGLQPEAARNFRDKARMKDVLRAHGLPCARHALAASVAEAVQLAEGLGYPLVVKPPAGAGAVATHRADHEQQLREALDAVPPSSSAPALLEEFITGDEHSLETVSIGGRAVWHSLTHYRPTPLEAVSQQWIQWCVLLPREVDDPRYDDIKLAAAAALQALGMTDGVSHMEWFRRRDGSVAIGEVGARPPGAQITTLISRAHDVDFLQLWARALIFGEFTPPERRFAAGVAFLRGQGAGRVQALRGLDAVAAELGSLITDYRLPHVGQTPTGSYEGEGYIVVRHAETRVVEAALARIVSLARIDLG